MVLQWPSVGRGINLEGPFELQVEDLNPSRLTEAEVVSSVIYIHPGREKLTVAEITIQGGIITSDEAKTKLTRLNNAILEAYAKKYIDFDIENELEKYSKENKPR